jgi:hypothetical protein
MAQRWKRYSGLVQGFASFLIVGGLIFYTLAPLILLIEAFEWVTGSEWPGLTIADGLALFGVIRDLPESETQRLLDLIMAIPLSISLFVVGILLLMSGIWLGNWIVRRDLRARYPFEE